MAAQNTEVLGNSITGHKTAGILAVSFQSLGIFFDPTTFDPYLRGFYAHDNTIADLGAAPDGPFADPAGLAPLVSGLFALLDASGLPARMPAVIWDGIVDVATGSTRADGEGGQYTGNLQICSKGNVTDLPVIPNVVSYENIDIDLLALTQGLMARPNARRMATTNCWPTSARRSPSCPATATGALARWSIANAPAPVRRV